MPESTDATIDLSTASTARRAVPGGKAGGKYPHQLVVNIDDDILERIHALVSSTPYTKSTLVRAALRQGLPQAGRLARGRRLKDGS